MLDKQLVTISTHSVQMDITRKLISLPVPTRFAQNGGSLIDQLYIQISSSTRVTKAGIIMSNISDHQPYFIVLDQIKPELIPLKTVLIINK